MARIIALIILLIPGVIAAYGIKLMRDMFFGLQAAWLPSLAIQFFLGLIMFLAGLSFIGGFLLHRDRKKNKVQQRFKRKEQ
ncbi:DUF2627 domain-containing protein [Jeotgalibacillus salarius]|uniref:DUF2627 domain-containing protein n=1 Tax=Jeotgalibacillus salarius TaxID=546023 RepID=A0A4Y8LP19_9BACL|nr:DUF2627 domain-containing protein [Jeotgalibacillus salarius]TFE03181.1 DUF2627 domain-containing protein [Jeotgalibacillus salarius]